MAERVSIIVSITFFIKTFPFSIFAMGLER